MENDFTQRMRQLCREAPKRCRGYVPTQFIRMINDSKGDFVPVAKKLLATNELQEGFERVAGEGAIDISMAWAIRFEPEWRSLFDHQERKTAEVRLRLAMQLAKKPTDKLDQAIAACPL